MKALVTGGAGYVGSVVAAQLLAAGHQVVVLDDLSRGHAGALPPGAEHAAISLMDADALRRPLEGVDAVLHFAALALVAESVEHPERYWHNNVTGTLNLLDAMRAEGVGKLVFSSTCATYGEPETARPSSRST
jgi:UDP-glucose 4-epimerase